MEISEEPHPHFVGVQNEELQIEGLQNVGDNNNIILNNTIGKNILSNPIISETDVMDQIGYEPQIKDAFIENIILIMVEVLNMPNNTTIE